MSSASSIPEQIPGRDQLEHANSKTHQGKETKAIFILEDIADIMKQMGDET